MSKLFSLPLINVKFSSCLKNKISKMESESSSMSDSTDSLNDSIEYMNTSDSSDTDEQEEIGNARKKIKIDNLDEILATFSDTLFEKLLRVDRIQFQKLLTIIKSDRSFQNPLVSSSCSAELQLAIVLYRLGVAGPSQNGIADHFGINSPSTVHAITEQVFNAFLRYLPKYISWPDAIERATIRAETREELPNCIGYIDTIEVKLSMTPVINRELYISRNKNYAIKVQVVCDNKKCIRDVVVGNPGSYTDARIWNKCHLRKKCAQVFSYEEWIAGDLAYPLENNLLIFFDPNSNTTNFAKRMAFNMRLNQYRARIEHCLGALKSRFESLREIHYEIKDGESQKFVCHWVLVCCIIHNVLLKAPSLIFQSSNDPIEVKSEVYENILTDALIAANQKRKAICDLMFENIDELNRMLDM